jgi:hypothetical protein
MTTIIKKKEVQIICPICKKEKQLNIPETIINSAKPLTTISIQKGLLCNHHFQAFIDKNFKVRGYQKIDFEVKAKQIKDQKKIESNKETSNFADNELFENLIMEGNYIEYTPENLISNDLNANSRRKNDLVIRKEMTLEQIYELFWDLIDDNNREFKELIVKDKKRRKSLKNVLNPLEH